MVRPRRRRLSPIPQHSVYPRLATLIGLLLVVGMLFTRVRDPEFFRWLARLDPPPAEVAVAQPAPPAGPAPQAAGAPQPADGGLPWETLVPGPGHDDLEERDAAREEFQALADRTPLGPEEMPAYWRLMRWSRAKPFAEMQRAARRDVLFTHLWEDPDQFRGEPIWLRMHVKRVLTHKAPRNSAGVDQVYEAWGWTEDSKSYPYVVVSSELPPRVPLGAEISDEVVFVGYFLKNMSYEAFDVRRAAPLLVGRLRRVEDPLVEALRADHGDNHFWLALGIGGVVLAAVIAAWILRRPRARPAVVSSTSGDGLPVDEWLEGAHREVGDLDSRGEAEIAEFPRDWPAGPDE